MLLQLAHTLLLSKEIYWLLSMLLLLNKHFFAFREALLVSDPVPTGFAPDQKTRRGRRRMQCLQRPPPPFSNSVTLLDIKWEQGFSALEVLISSCLCSGSNDAEAWELRPGCSKQQDGPSLSAGPSGAKAVETATPTTTEQGGEQRKRADSESEGYYAMMMTRSLLRRMTI